LIGNEMAASSLPASPSTCTIPFTLHSRSRFYWPCMSYV